MFSPQTGDGCDGRFIYTDMSQTEKQRGNFQTTLFLHKFDQNQSIGGLIQSPKVTSLDSCALMVENLL